MEMEVAKNRKNRMDEIDEEAEKEALAIMQANWNRPHRPHYSRTKVESRQTAIINGH